MFSYVNEHVKIYFQFSKRSFSHCVCVCFHFQDFFTMFIKKRKDLHISQIYYKSEP